MYHGNNLDVTSGLAHAQAERYTPKRSFFEGILHRLLPLVPCVFIAVDFFTISTYAMTIFNESAELAYIVAGVLALVLDLCPSVSATLMSHTAGFGNKRERHFKMWLLLGAAIAAYIVFCGFGVTASLMELEQRPSTGSGGLSGAVAAQEQQTAATDQRADTLSMAAQLIRMLIPLVTSVGSFGLSYDPDHERVLAELKQQRLQLKDMKIDVENRIKHMEHASEVYNADEDDYQYARAKLHAICLAAQAARIECRISLTEELGTVEAANALLGNAGMGDLFNEEELMKKLLPPDKLKPCDTADALYMGKQMAQVS